MGYSIPRLFDTLLISGQVHFMVNSIGESTVESRRKYLTHCSPAAPLSSPLLTSPLM
jgi:hypothetical protein